MLAATRELLVEVGYQRTTIAAVARRAGVGAPTIYRRWPRREALIEDAAFGHTQPAPLPAATGNLYADLRAWVEAFLAQLADPVTRAAIPGLLVAYHRDETLYERLVSRSEEDVRAQLVELLAADGLQQRADAVFDLFGGVHRHPGIDGRAARGGEVLRPDRGSPDRTCLFVVAARSGPRC
ncbi:TetR/AcrR family transcriptional regulator [Mycobacterium heckeshornense]|uniref:TetR/AcrR family transcriptional regulator n=1 Tax=Mycobacterium heckeshornense TaxID=110505 RepID=UPI001F3F7A84|nr:TetR/AcrR family transcriptional regulator [Mycobacterium heckeshornense]